MVALAVYAVWQLWPGKTRPVVKLGALALLIVTLLPGLLWPAAPVDAPPLYADTVNVLVKSGDTVWLAPAEFGDWLAIDAPNAAAPYYMLYPWLWDSPTIRADLMAKLERNAPDVLYYDRDGKAGGVGASLANYAPELTAWVDANYTPVGDNVYVLR